MSIKSYRDLEVWRRSIELAEKIYSVVRQLPPDERFGLSSQMRRASVSVPSNIAEGSGYGTTRRYVHHLRIAAGSNCELQTQLTLSARLRLLEPAQVDALLNQSNEIGRMLSGLIRSLQKNS